MAIGCGPILIVDDDSSFRELISSLLRQAGYATREAATGGEALVAAGEDPPSLGIIDVMLPGMSGYEVCRALRDEFGETLPIVFVSGVRTESIDRVAGLLLGADDYLFKPFAPEELLARVRRSLSRYASLRANPQVAEALGLTAREREILALLADGLKQDLIAQELVISPKTVATHIGRILIKMGVHSRAEAVSVAYRDRLVEVDAHEHPRSRPPVTSEGGASRSRRPPV